MPSSSLRMTPTVDYSMGVGIEVRELENPRSLVNLVPPKFREAILNLPDNLFTYKERYLKKEAKPDYVDGMVRMRFWGEYYQAQDEKRKMEISNITFGVTSTEYIYGNILNNPRLLAWVIRPPQDLMLQQSEALSVAINYQRQILETIMEDESYYNKKTVVKRDGTEVVEKKLNVSALAEIRKIAETLSMRVQGAIIQKLAVDQRHTFQAGDTHIDIPSLPETDLDQLENLNKTLQRINKSLGKAEKNDVIDAEAEEVNGDGHVSELRREKAEAGGSSSVKEEGSSKEDAFEVETPHFGSPSF